MTRVLVDDGARHTELTGYGNLSRAILSSLKQYTDLELIIRQRPIDIPEWVREKALLDTIPLWRPEDEYDCVLHICSPGRKVREKKPCLIYTQNALSMLKPEWIEGLKRVNGVIVPGEFDARVFRNHFENVHVCHQYTDDELFQPKTRFRREGPKPFSFLFVGSFGYRKGVDLLLQALPRAFDLGQKINLTLHCFSGFERAKFNYLLDAARALPENLSLTVYNGSKTPDWMARIYNQHDVVVSLSRGEGWCMPMHEALLSQKPVIAADNTAMNEYLPRKATIMVPTTAKAISEISDPFGLSFRDYYGFPGNMSFDADLDASVAALRRIYFDYEYYSAAAKDARQFILESYSRKSMAANMLTAINSVLT